MANIKLPYVNKVKAKGRTYYRYRRSGTLLSLPCDPTLPEFMTAYNKIHTSFEIVGNDTNVVMQGSIAALIIDFRKSADFISLSPRTKELYLSHLDDISTRFGRFQIKSMTRNVVMTFRDSMVDNPGKANNSLKILSRLYSFAVDRGMADVSPVLRIKKLKMGSYRPWTPEEIGKFKAVASPNLRLALSLALYTGQRQADIIKLKWGQFKDNGIELKQQKTGKNLWIPIHHALKEELEKASKETPTVVTTQAGQPYGRGWFITEWRKTSCKACLPEECVFHGLRKTAAVCLAEAGCTNEQIKAITGHTTERMVAYYTRGANQRSLAIAAMKKFEQN